MGKPRGTAPGVGEHNLRFEDSWSWLGGGGGVSGPAGRPGPSGSQALWHPGTPGNLRRAENEVGAQGLDLTWG
jgi:hypothetical protein